MIKFIYNGILIVLGLGMLANSSLAFAIAGLWAAVIGYALFRKDSMLLRIVANDLNLNNSKPAQVKAFLGLALFLLIISLLLKFKIIA